MTVHEGRHVMPGWRGYLPDSVDRASRGRPGRRRTRRVAAVGALAVCVVAGGAVITQTRSLPGPDPAAEPDGAGDPAASVTARSAAWTQEAGPVLGAVEHELGRVDAIRKRWEASPAARRPGPSPGAVVALLARQATLAEHRTALRDAMAAVRARPASEPALDGARGQLWSAQQMLRAIDAGRGALGDPVEAAVMRLVDGVAAPPEDRRAGSVAPGAPVRDATVELAATTVDAVERPVTRAVRAAGTPEARTAGAASSVTSASAADVEPEAPVASPSPATAPPGADPQDRSERAAPAVAAPADVDDGADEGDPGADPEVRAALVPNAGSVEDPGASPAPAGEDAGPVDAGPVDSILTFDRTAADGTTAATARHQVQDSPSDDADGTDTVTTALRAPRSG
ncbi:hypothetical protein Acsp06_45560 [Actinomycetospora sp. NBRC 106375]|uniref:hypothetical protein n=1 Tax=Actinomycetospora sp. NBRC 106375 TaxID=3032207 RepID=UPI0024A192E1|nr:hypothetical protein [Actinomycetospora sp. NBRC 106375]GLZ48371.1 hypothetical protein Acsp06_45560 [Actinomycetospora sp. NBRC 106375]